MQLHAYNLASLWKVWLASHTTAIAVVSMDDLEMGENHQLKVISCSSVSNLSFTAAQPLHSLVPLNPSPLMPSYVTTPEGVAHAHCPHLQIPFIQ